MGHGETGAEERAAQVHIHDAVEVFGLHADQQLVFVDSGIVHQDVDAAEVLHKLLDDLSGLVFLRDVAANKEGFSTGLVDLVYDHGGEFGAGVEINADLGSGLGETGGDNSADAPGSPGDQCDFATQVDTGHLVSLPARAAAGCFGFGLLVHAGQVFPHDVDHAQVHVAYGGADGG